MKRVLKNFKDFSINENIENEVPMDDQHLENPEIEESTTEVEEEESPLSQLSEKSGLPISKDDKGDFIKTNDGDVIRYFSETGYYNETKRKKYDEDIQSVLNDIGIVTESRRNRCCLPGQCSCKTKRR